jgi:riboflavin synthase
LFSGIIEELGTVKQITFAANAMELTIGAKQALADLKLGDSIAVNGVCLTVTSFVSDSFTVDIMPETFKSTSLAMLSQGAQVNLERALAVGSRLGGHFVTGHVDATGKIVSLKPCANAVYYQIELTENLLPYCIDRGSIAIDGTSLTIFGIEASTITVSLIPHTVEHSILGQKKVGEIVNIECDMLGKYIAHLLGLAKQSAPATNNLTSNFFNETWI